MPLPPGPIYLAHRLPSLLVPPFSVYLLNRVLSSYFNISLPSWAVIVSAISAVPLGAIIRFSCIDYINRKNAAALGAVLPPYVKDKYPFGLGILTETVNNLKTGYPG